MQSFIINEIVEARCLSKKELVCQVDFEKAYNHNVLFFFFLMAAYDHNVLDFLNHITYLKGLTIRWEKRIRGFFPGSSFQFSLMGDAKG